jgi:hypothetical protein
VPNTVVIIISLMLSHGSKQLVGLLFVSMYLSIVIMYFYFIVPTILVELDPMKPLILIIYVLGSLMKSSMEFALD